MGARRIVTKQSRKASLSAALSVWQTPGWLTRRLLGGAILFSVLGGLLGAGVWQLLQSETLPIEHVQVEGEFRYLDKQDLYAAIGDLTSNGFFAVDVHAIKQAAEHLAWVDRVSVRRIWPNVLQVMIVEHVPLARWNDGRIVNRRGELIDVQGDAQKVSLLKGLPLFLGPEGTAEVLAKRFQSMSQSLLAMDVVISALSISPRHAWQVSLSNGLQLLLGRAATDTQLARFSAVYEKVLAQRLEQIQAVDLRYTNGFAVRWKAALG